MRRDPSAYLRDAIEAATRVANKMDGVTLQELERDDDLRSVVLFKLQVVGEALRHYSRLEEDRASAITDLDKIISTRNIIVHGYFKISVAIIHHIATIDIHRLILELKTLVPDDPLVDPL